MANELKPCPFCGPGESVVECYADDYGYWKVGCGRCGSHSGTRPKSDPDAQAKVIAHWNTRPAAPVEGLETVKRELLGAVKFFDDFPPSIQNMANIRVVEAAHKYVEQAEAIIAAKDRLIQSLIDLDSDEVKRLEADNAKLTARVKELIAVLDQQLGTPCEQIAHSEEVKYLETKLVTTRKALEFYADVHKYPAPLTSGMGDLWSDCGETAKKALAETFIPTHTHLKRGSSYSYFGTGTFQTESWVYPHRYIDMGEKEEDMLSCDMQQVAVYLEEDGKIWVRPVGEFTDGRFAKV